MSESSQKYSRVPFALWFLGACLSAWGINRTLGGWDENAMLLYYGYSSFKTIATTYFDANNHIFHSLWVHLMTLCFGEENALAVRFPTYFFGLASLWMIYLTARKVFSSSSTACLALFLSAAHPVFIHYAQTARGYSLMMFFSSATLYCALKIMESPTWKGGLTFSLCGVLAVYTLPTSIYFLIALGFWIFWTLWKRGHQATGGKNSIAVFIGAYLLTAILLTLLFLPLWKQVMAVAESHTLVQQNKGSLPRWLTELSFGIVSQNFPGWLMGLLPFFLVGLWTSFRSLGPIALLPWTIFLVPLVINAITGIAGFPRNYLFNFPVWMLFTAEGIRFVWNECRSRFPHYQKVFAVGLITCFLAAFWKEVVVDVYKAHAVPDGSRYHSALVDKSPSDEFLVITEPKHYLYARSVVKERTLQAIRNNQVKSLALVAENSAQAMIYKPSFRDKPNRIFQNLLNPNHLQGVSLAGGKMLFSLIDGESFAVLPIDFDSKTEWKIISGMGTVATESNLKLAGATALRLKADSGTDLVVATQLSYAVSVLRPSLALMLWATHSFNDDPVSFHPILSFPIHRPSGKQDFQVPMGKINEGMNLTFSESSFSWSPFTWNLKSTMGKFPVGSYQFTIWLKCKAGTEVLYDGLRLFLLDVDEDLLHPNLKRTVSGRN